MWRLVADAEVRFVVGGASKRGRTKAAFKLTPFRREIHVFLLDAVRFAEADLALFRVWGLGLGVRGLGFRV